MANRNRWAGHQFECDTVNLLKEIGFTEAVTSRSESRRTDNTGIDIMYVPGFDLQCKCTVPNPNYHELIEKMPDNGKIKAVAHRKTAKSKTGKFMVKGEYVTVKLEDFLKLIKRFQRKKTL